MEKVVLLADKNSSSWKFAEKIQKYIKEKYEIVLPLEEVCINSFRNKEIDMHVPHNVRKKDVYFVHDSSKYPQDWWIQLLLVKDLLLSASADSVSFILPNMLYSRKDRKDQPHVPISARTLSKSISTGLRRIITMDLHAPQIQGFYPENVPVDNLYSFPEVVKHLREKHLDDLNELVIVSPDAGGVDRVRSFLQRLERTKTNENENYSMAFIIKIRPKAGEIEKMDLIGDVNNKSVLLVDDIIDSGNTNIKAAELLKQNGAKKLFAYGTHGIFTKGTNEISKHFEEVMTSNTYFHENNDLEVIDVSSVFAEAIYRAQKGMSISKLFE